MGLELLEEVKVELVVGLLAAPWWPVRTPLSGAGRPRRRRRAPPGSGWHARGRPGAGAAPSPPAPAGRAALCLSDETTT